MYILMHAGTHTRKFIELPEVATKLSSPQAPHQKLTGMVKMKSNETIFTVHVPLDCVFLDLTVIKSFKKQF